MNLRFKAPTGFTPLKANIVYTEILRDVPSPHGETKSHAPQDRTVLLVGFEEHVDKKGHIHHKPHVLEIQWGRLLGALKPTPRGQPAPVEGVKGETLPSWLARFEGKDLAKVPELNEIRGKKVITVRAEAERRVACIGSAIAQIPKILASPRRHKLLNQLAEAAGQNWARFQLWFYLYVAYGRVAWPLMPDRKNLGNWDRKDEKYKDREFGTTRIHFSGTPQCWTSEDMVEAIVTDFKSFAEQGMRMVDVWSLGIRSRGAKILEDEERPTAYHPAGDPIYSYDKFRYYCEEELGRKFVRERLYGKEAVEDEGQPIAGGQSDGIMALGQRAHFDTAHVKQLPLSYIGNYPLPPLLSVDLTDAACSHIDGIGFSLGSEKTRGYRYALFCAAIDKVRFGQIIGYPISSTQWRGKGLPASIFSDRGPGASKELRAAAPWISSFRMSRSRRPRDNGQSEGKHDRRKKRAGRIVHEVSNLTVNLLMKREVERVILKNWTDSALGKIPDEAVVEKGVSTPAQFRQWLEEDKFRSDLIQITFEEAVRAFLDPVTLVYDGGVIRLKTRTYRVTEPLAKALGRIRTGTELPGFVYQLATRFIWLDIRGELFEIEAFGKDRPDVLNASLPELEVIADRRSKVEGARRAVNPMRTAAAHQKFKRETGKEWLGGTVVAGPRKLTKKAIDEAARINSLE
jgi:hypothetical protein